MHPLAAGAGAEPREDILGADVNRRRAAYTPGILSLVSVLLVSLACGDGASVPDLVLVSVDTLRPDHLGIYGYDRDTTPNLDGFFASGRVYTRAYSTSASTAPSVVSLLTGRLPQEHRVRVLYQLVPDEVKLLTDRLPEHYQTAAFVSSIVLTEEAIGMSRRFDHYDDFVDEQESSREIWERNAARTTDAALAWLRDVRDPERPVFLWVHYIDPHAPYRPPPEWGKRFEGTRTKPVEPHRIKSYMQEPDFSNAWDYVDRYDDEVAYTDEQIGRLLAGYGPGLDDALVVFTADHGETMLEHELWFAHGFQVYEAILRVPLMLRGPGVRPGPAARAAHGTDVAPTLLRAAGVEIPDDMLDVDLRTGEGLGDDRVLVGEAFGAGGQWRASIQGDRKWVVFVRGPGRNVMLRRHYELAGDPDEKKPRAWRGDEAGARTLIEIVKDDPDPAGNPGAYEQGMQIRGPKVDPRANDAAREKLRALGYVE